MWECRRVCLFWGAAKNQSLQDSLGAQSTRDRWTPTPPASQPASQRCSCAAPQHAGCRVPPLLPLLVAPHLLRRAAGRHIVGELAPDEVRLALPAGSGRAGGAGGINGGVPRGASGHTRGPWHGRGAAPPVASRAAVLAVPAPRPRPPTHQFSTVPSMPPVVLSQPRHLRARGSRSVARSMNQYCAACLSGSRHLHPALCTMHPRVGAERAVGLGLQHHLVRPRPAAQALIPQRRGNDVPPTLDSVQLRRPDLWSRRRPGMVRVGASEGRRCGWRRRRPEPVLVCAPDLA